jgi:hypothetical protein
MRNSNYCERFFAYELIEDCEESPEFLRFAKKYSRHVKDLTRLLLDSSPCEKVFFTTDWEVGPSQVTRGGDVGFREFWKKHDQGELRLNGCYMISPENA